MTDTKLNPDLKIQLLDAVQREIAKSIDSNYWEWIDQLLEVMLKIKHL